MKLKFFLRIVVLSSTPFAASAQDWDWKFTPYLWSAGIEGDVALGPISSPVEMDFSELVDILAGAALMHAEARRDDHTVFADLTWLSIEPDSVASPGGSADVQLDTTILEAGYVHAFSRVGLELGVRYWDFELEIDPALFSPVKRDDHWTDVFVGLRHEVTLGSKWQLTTEANAGAGGSDFTWGVQLVFARELNGGNAFVAGLKILDIDYFEQSVNGIPFELDTTFAGATIGFQFD